MQYIVFVILAPLGATTSLALTIYAWNRRSVPGARILAYLAALISGWLIANTLELITPTESGTLVWAKVTYLFISTAEVTWLAFALEHAGRSWWLAPSRLVLFCVIPLTTMLLLLTNEYNHLVWQSYLFVPAPNNMLAIRITSYGVWFWVQWAYNYILVLLGAALIARASFRSFRLYQQQAIWMVIGAIIPLTVNVIHVFHLVPGLTKDFSPIAFALASVTFAVGIFRFRLFDLKPIARNVLVDNMSDGMIVTDELRRIVDINPAAQKMIGLPADSVIGQLITSTLAAWGLPAEKSINQQETQYEISLAQEEGRCYYDLHVSPLQSQHGQLMGYLITLHDVTERHRLIHELDAYAHTVAHDLKGPLSSLIGYAEILRAIPDHQLGRELRDPLGQISQASQKMVTIVDGLLLLASVRQSTKVMSEPLDMAFIITEARNRSAALAEEAQAHIIMPDEWPVAVGFAPWVEEIWANYIGNAIKYGGQPPHIELGANSQPDGTVRFWVRDNGPGLAPEQAAQLFVPFTRLSQAKASGHGLGLSIVQRITERMGGTVGVESQPGQGSLFFFTLPEATATEMSR